MNRALLGLVLPGLLVVSGGTALAITSTGADIASGIAASAADLVEKPEFSWARIDADLRDVVVTGTATDKAAIDALVAQVSGLPGVRTVENATVLAEFASPFPFSARRDGDAVTLEGGIPDEAVRALIAERLPDADDQLELLSGAPDRTSFLSLVDYTITILSHLDRGVVNAEDLSLEIEGRAASQEDFAALAELRRQGPPDGLTILRANIEPPLADPFEIIAKKDGTTIAVTGVAPDNRAIASIAAVEGVTVGPALQLASGAPEGFMPKALVALENLAMLEYGEARISGALVSLRGAPPDPGIAALVTEAMATIDADLTLEPPRVADYRLTATKDLAGLSFIGSVPDEATRSRLAQTDAADVASVSLARGAPTSFAASLDFALAVLSRLSEGEVTVDSQGLTVFGRASGPADYDALQAMLGGSTQSVTMVSADIKPAIVAPYTWSVDKTADGTVTLSGYTASPSERAAIASQFQGVDSDTSRIADGAPAQFAASVAHAAEMLPNLASGRIAFDGTRWQVSGTVANPTAEVTLRRYLAVNDLIAQGWQYNAALTAAEPTAAPSSTEPFRWQAEKEASGALRLDGFSPSTSFQSLVALRADGASDETVIHPGAPTGFAADALAGLDALADISEGVLRFENGVWSLTGVAATSAARDAARETLSARLSDTSWQFSVEAQDLPPVANPYTFLAVRAADGITTLSGHLLSDDLRRMVMIKAGEAAVDRTVIATGEPSGFVADVLAGLDALAALETGTLSFDGTRWSLSGNAAAQTDTARIEAALSRSAQGAAGWTQAITIPEAPQASVPESQIAVPEAASPPEPAATEAEAAATDPVDPPEAETVAAEDRAEPEAPVTTAPVEAPSPQLALAPTTGVDAQETPSVDGAALLAQCQAEVDALASRNAILFRSGSDALTDESLPVIDELAGYIAHCPGAIVHVEGHTDADGADDLNLALSVARAEAVVFALMDRGVALDRLYALGYGESLPIADNDTAAGKQRNRRIEFKILEDNR
ncbi:OmpA family protein [Devosia enhydra]|nr:OmpA family protein [Devosia enhydra]